MADFSQHHLLGIRGLTKADVELIFETAKGFKDIINRPIRKVPSLRDLTVANLFFENSTRTRLSFELAQKALECRCREFLGGFIQRKKGRDAGGYGPQHLGDEGGLGGDAPPPPGARPLFGHKDWCAHYQCR